MKGLLRKGLCLALGLAWSWTPGFGQELNFRAVVAPKSSAAPIPVSLDQPIPLTEAGYIARAKNALDEPLPIFVQEAKPMPPLKEVPRPMPGTSGVPVFPPPPQIIVSPEGIPHVVGQSPMMVMPSGCGDGCGDSCGGDACDSCGCFGGWRPGQRIADWLGGGCDLGCNTGCCPPRSPIWLRAEYLVWNTSRQNIPALVNRAADGDFANLAPPPVGTGNPTNIFDQGNLNNSSFNGARVGFGFWLPRHSDWGFDVSMFRLSPRTTSFVAGSNGTPAIGRPFFNTDPAVNGIDAEIVASAGFPGTVTISSRTEIWGVDPNLRHKLWCGCDYWVDGLIGYRHFQLSDRISIHEDLLALDQIGAPTRFTVDDRFATRNSFNGGQVGLEGEWKFWRRWSLNWSAKLAIGNVNQVVAINGFTTSTTPPGRANTQILPGGLLAQGTNIGRYSKDQFAVLPEFGIKLGYDLTDHLRLYAGYNVLYLSSVVRAGDQIDNRVNGTQIPRFGGQTGVIAAGESRTPAVLFKTTDFWAQGANFGLEWHY